MNIISRKEGELQSQSLKEFPILMNVQYLNLSYNQITLIPYQIIQMENLEILILNHNQISEFPKVPLPRLRTLEISDNQLLSTDFSYLNLTCLDIQYNSFQIYQHHPTLERLSLSWFTLIDMSAQQFDLRTSKIGVQLRENHHMNFSQFVNIFSNFTDTIFIKAIQYDEHSIIPSMCESHSECLTKLQHPQPLILAAKLNIRIYKILLSYLHPTLLLVQFVFLWACDRLEVEVVEHMLESGIMVCWSDQMKILSQALCIPLRGVIGDTPLHFAFRRQCRSETDYVNQMQIVQQLLKHQNPNQKNSKGVAPIHEILLIPSLRSFANCRPDQFDYTKRMGPSQDSIMHIATQMGYIQAIQLFTEKVSMFTVNKFNKTPKYTCSPSVTILKYVRKLEIQELRSILIQSQQHLQVSIRNPQDFHISVNEGDNLYNLLFKDIVLTDKLIIVILINMLQFKLLYQIKFTSLRIIQPIQIINNCHHNFHPDVKEFRKRLSDQLSQNLQLMAKPTKQQEIIVRKTQRQQSINLDQIIDHSNELYELVSFYPLIGMSGNLSNRTSLLDYEEFQQKQFRKTQFHQRINKTYVSGRQQSPLPMKYSYDNFVMYRKNKSITLDLGHQIKDNSLSNYFRQ
ncbi:unnamed protein product (macronuclear) [Paramecium tetraurelia]|uniref:Uncharacterized protein n=1 Tax=Paramecium tetraurelia TaxID=5888 RepID=A0CAV3_PARTE|nr:uncharacterized protein GSPATT00036701001 [Paramecium tetraurelia]CAK67920.1 unnamed protein product [Paramecium tetraurelia]|eukprot:XP_001435317.1 hypothetical protein (macronuclear) [Paramecium tetraurelia strain d4-2]